MKAALIYGAIIVLSVINYNIVRNSFVYPQEWIDMIILKCGHGKTTLDERTLFTDSAFIKTGLVSAIFGAYFGILYDSHYLGGTQRKANRTSLYKTLMRIFIGSVIVLPFTIPYFVLTT